MICKYYTALYKGLEHPLILITSEVLESSLVLLRDSCIINLFVVTFVTFLLNKKHNLYPILLKLKKCKKMFVILGGLNNIQFLFFFD